MSSNRSAKYRYIVTTDRMLLFRCFGGKYLAKHIAVFGTNYLRQL